MQNSIYKKFIASALMMLTLGIYNQTLRAQEKSESGGAQKIVAAPFNDTFENAISVFNNSSVSGTNVDATREAGEPFHAGFAGERSVWYRHTATGSGSLRISLSSDNSNSVISVYTGMSFGDLRPVAANAYTSNVENLRRVIIGTQAGKIYFIAVSSRTQSNGAFTLSLKLENAAPNDNFVNAEILNSVGDRFAFTTGTTVGASKETGEPNHAGNAGGRSVWFRWTAPDDGITRSYTFSTAGTTRTTDSQSLITLLAIYTGGSVNALTEVISDSAYNNKVIFTPTPGAVYHIAVDGYDTGAGVETGTINLSWHVTRSTKATDFDGDERADICVFRPTTGTWYSLDSLSGNFRAARWGANGDKPVSMSLVGDERPEYTVFRPDTGTWFIRRENGALIAQRWGLDTDIPVPGFYFGTLAEQIAVFRPSDGTWYFGLGEGVAIPFGQSGDVPVPADYDGDGITDIAVFRPSSGFWYIRRSTDYQLAYRQFGQAGDKPVAADYDNDGRIDVAVYRPSNGTWYAVRSTDGTLIAVPYGGSGDQPQPGDYDGDNRGDFAVYRPSTGVWYIRLATGEQRAVQFGASTDLPATADNLIQ